MYSQLTWENKHTDIWMLEKPCEQDRSLIVLSPREKVHASEDTAKISGAGFLLGKKDGPCNKEDLFLQKEPMHVTFWQCPLKITDEIGVKGTNTWTTKTGGNWFCAGCLPLRNSNSQDLRSQFGSLKRDFLSRNFTFQSLTVHYHPFFGSITKKANSQIGATDSVITKKFMNSADEFG